MFSVVVSTVRILFGPYERLHEVTAGVGRAVRSRPRFDQYIVLLATMVVGAYVLILSNDWEI